MRLCELLEALRNSSSSVWAGSQEAKFLCCLFCSLESGTSGSWAGCRLLPKQVRREHTPLPDNIVALVTRWTKKTDQL